MIDKSTRYLAEIESRLSGNEELISVLALVEECADAMTRKARREHECNTIRVQLDRLDRQFDDLQASLDQLQQMRQHAERLLASSAHRDYRLTTTLNSFRSDYLEWATTFLKQADEVTGVSQEREELQEQLDEIMDRIQQLDEEIVDGTAAVNTFLEKEFQVTFPTPAAQRAFLDKHYAGRREEMARVGRLRKILDEWKSTVGHNAADFAAAYLRQCQVVGATCLGIDAEGEVSDIEFDWVIVDEAARATKPELLVPLVRGRKAILVGDHLQLPPTLGADTEAALVHLPDVTRETLQKSYFQDLIEQVDESGDYHDLPVPDAPRNWEPDQPLFLRGQARQPSRS